MGTLNNFSVRDGIKRSNIVSMRKGDIEIRVRREIWSIKEENNRYTYEEINLTSWERKNKKTFKINERKTMLWSLQKDYNLADVTVVRVDTSLW